jgi:hypothetical protein
MRTVPCSSEQCKQPIVWLRTRPGNKPMPLNPGSSEDGTGNVAVWRDGESGKLVCRVLKKSEQVKPGEWRYVNHWSTCAARATFKSSERSAAADAVSLLARQGRKISLRTPQAGDPVSDVRCADDRGDIVTHKYTWLLDGHPVTPEQIIGAAKALEPGREFTLDVAELSLPGWHHMRRRWQYADDQGEIVTFIHDERIREVDWPDLLAQLHDQHPDIPPLPDEARPVQQGELL